MNRKTVFIVSALVLVAVFGAGVLLFKSDKLSRWSAVVGQNQAALARDHAPLLGNPGARVHIVEFMDPACETCAEFYPHVKRILAANPDRVKVSIRHVHLHPGSEDVVRMLGVARSGRQGSPGRPGPEPPRPRVRQGQGGRRMPGVGPAVPE